MGHSPIKYEHPHPCPAAYDMEPCILIPEVLNELTVACTRITHLTLHYVVGDLFIL